MSAIIKMAAEDTLREEIDTLLWKYGEVLTEDEIRQCVKKVTEDYLNSRIMAVLIENATINLEKWKEE